MRMSPSFARAILSVSGTMDASRTLTALPAFTARDKAIPARGKVSRDQRIADAIVRIAKTFDAEFDENKHPRADNGQFGRGSGKATVHVVTHSNSNDDEHEIHSVHDTAEGAAKAHEALVRKTYAAAVKDKYRRSADQRDAAKARHDAEQGKMLAKHVAQARKEHESAEDEAEQDRNESKADGVMAGGETYRDEKGALQRKMVPWKPYERKAFNEKDAEGDFDHEDFEDDEEEDLPYHPKSVEDAVEALKGEGHDIDTHAVDVGDKEGATAVHLAHSRGADGDEPSFTFHGGDAEKDQALIARERAVKAKFDASAPTRADGVTSDLQDQEDLHDSAEAWNTQNPDRQVEYADSGHYVPSNDDDEGSDFDTFHEERLASMQNEKIPFINSEDAYENGHLDKDEDAVNLTKHKVLRAA